MAFDTVNHEILIEVLEHQFGVTNTALSWFKTCLYPRTFIVDIDSHHSREIHVVPDTSKIKLNGYAETIPLTKTLELITELKRSVLSNLSKYV